VATLSEAVEIHVCGWEFNRNSRLESNLSQFSIIEPAENTHHNPAKPTVVSTSTPSEFDEAVNGLSRSLRHAVWWFSLADRNSNPLPFIPVKRSGPTNHDAVRQPRIMDTTREPPPDTRIDDVVTRYLNAKAKGRGGGNYRNLASAALGRWTSWLESRGITHLNGLDDGVLRSYAQDLRSAVRNGNLAASTANTYYATVRACLNWAEEDGLLTDNPAAATRATTELPEDTSEPDRQFWSPGDVHTLVADLTERIDETVSEGGIDAATGPMRDRALVSLLASTGVRGAEVFRDSDDDRDGRQGLRWSRVDLDSGSLLVFGKNQDWEHAQLPTQARDHLRRHKDVQQPASEEWPVFPTQHTPSLYDAVRTQLGQRNWVADDVESLLDDQEIDEVLREHDVVPPAITVRGARSVMQRLCERAELNIDGEYLMPHGARRGLGDLLYRESAELAQSALRHQSVRTTHDAYSHIDASETADAVGDVLDDAWGVEDDQDDSKEL